MTKTKLSESRFSPLMKQCFVTAAICSNTIGHGCSVGYTAVLLPQLHTPHAAIILTPETDSWIASIVGISMFFGNFLSPPIMDRFGRKVALFSTTLVSMAGWLLLMMATDVQDLIIGRFLLGLSFGMILPLRSIMLGEYTSPTNRGAFLATISLSQAFGIFFVHLLGTFMSWQQTALVITFFFFISTVIILYCPESPSFLAAKGKFDACRKAFRWLRGDHEEQELEAMIEACLLVEEIKIGRKSAIRRVDLREKCAVLKKKEFYKPIILMTHAYFMSQFSGGSVMANFPIQIIGRLMGPEANVNFWMVVLDIERITCNTIAIFVINKTKRRTMMFSTIGLCIFAHLGIAGYVYAKANDKLVFDGLWIPVLLIGLQVISVGSGTVPLPSVIAGEIFPLQYRSIGGSISVMVLAVTLFVCLKTFPLMLESIGLHGTYAVYAGILSYNLFVIWILLPETKDRTLQDIEEEFRGRKFKRDEIAARQSLQTDPLYMRKMSQRSSIAVMA